MEIFDIRGLQKFKDSQLRGNDEGIGHKLKEITDTDKIISIMSSQFLFLANGRN